MTTVAVVTGASSGIGFHTADLLVKRGCVVYDLSRHGSDRTGVTHIDTDLCDEAAVTSAIERVVREQGRIDLLINNAGFGISGAVEFTDTDDAARLFDVNFFGAVRASKAVIPVMRKQGSGKIVNISSVAALAPIPFQTYYSAAKSALLSYTMATANELKPFGVIVTSVLPGDIKTGFTAAREKSAAGDAVYGGRIAASVSRMEKDEQGGMSPEKAAATIVRIALGRHKKPMYVIGVGYRVLVLLIKLLPASLVNSIIKLLYAK